MVTNRSEVMSEIPGSAAVDRKFVILLVPWLKSHPPDVVALETGGWLDEMESLMRP